MKLHFLSTITMLFIFGCGDEFYNNRVADNDDDRIFIESEPSISPDKSYISYIVIDTASPQNSGIYRALISNPVAGKLLSGNEYHSPSLNFDNNEIVYLNDSGYIFYYNIINQTIDTSTIIERFESILYINPSSLLAHRGITGGEDDSIFLISVSGQVDFLLEGWDPTFYARDTFVYINVDDSNYYHILKSNILTIAKNHPETLFTIKSFPAIPRWPSLNDQGNRLTYSLTWADQNFIYSAETYSTEFNFIDSSDYDKPLILGNDILIYTDWYGRFHKSNFLGTQSDLFTK